MRRPQQNPLPGVGGEARIGRRAAASSRDRPINQPGRLPLGWETRVEEADVLLHVRILGEPRAKMRPRQTMPRLVGTGFVEKGQARSGDVRVAMGHTYTPRQTEEAETALRWVFIGQRRMPYPTPHPVGVLAFFQTAGTQADADNLFKLVGDAMNGTIVDDDQQIVEAHIHLLRRATEPATDLLVWSTQRRIPGG